MLAFNITFNYFRHYFTKFIPFFQFIIDSYQFKLKKAWIILQNCRNVRMLKTPSLTFQLNEKLSKDDLQKKSDSSCHTIKTNLNLFYAKIGSSTR